MKPRNTARASRLADQIQRELAEAIRLEFRDPRVGMVTLTGVELSPDNKHAKVFFTTMAGTEDHSSAEHILAHAGGFLRSHLAHQLNTRTVPQLHFKYDESVERGMRLSKLIDDAVASDPKQND